MKPEKIYHKYELHTNKWIDELSRYTEESFRFKPSQGEWCMAQVCDHLIGVTEKCLENVQVCHQKHGETGHSGIGPAFFSLMGSFPPVRLRIKNIPVGMERIYQPESISVGQARQGLENALANMKKNLPLVKVSFRKMRTRHWAGGWFNAVQWYHSAEMHLKHHFRQKKRIDNFLKKAEGSG